MAKIYQYDASGYYVGEVEDYGLLPNNATYTAPREQDGHIPRWNGKEWEQAENHKGKEGYKDRQPFTVKEYGPLPEGWTAEAPDPTPKEQAAEAYAYILYELAALDSAYLTPRVLAGLAQGDAFAQEQYRIHEEKAAPWRQRLAAIPEPAAE